MGGEMVVPADAPALDDRNFYDVFRFILCSF
jgi:hypothetical protein